MKRKDQWLRVSYDNRPRSELRILKNFGIKEKVEIFDKENRLVENWTDLSSGENNKFKITLFVQGDGQKNFSEDDSSYIVYYLKESARKSRTERDKNLKETHSHFLKEKKPGLIGSEQKYENEIKWFLRGEPSNFSIDLTPDNSISDIRHIKDENIKIKVKFILANEVSPEEVFNDFTSSQQSSWGWGKITLVVILATTLLLVIVFWKKIWRWLKGESKQEKKVREQIDIF